MRRGLSPERVVSPETQQKRWGGGRFGVSGGTLGSPGGPLLWLCSAAGAGWPLGRMKRPSASVLLLAGPALETSGVKCVGQLLTG